KQWQEGDIAPQVVFEVTSPGNRLGKMIQKFRFYEKYGVEEYYAYDPNDIELSGWLRRGAELQEIPEMDGWVSPRLRIRFDRGGETLRIVGPDGRPFRTYVELAAEVEQARQDRRRAEAELERAEQERRRAEHLAAQLRTIGQEPES